MVVEATGRRRSLPGGLRARLVRQRHVHRVHVPRLRRHHRAPCASLHLRARHQRDRAARRVAPITCRHRASHRRHAHFPPSHDLDDAKAHPRAATACARHLPHLRAAAHHARSADGAQVAESPALRRLGARHHARFAPHAGAEPGRHESRGLAGDSDRRSAHHRPGRGQRTPAAGARRIDAHPHHRRRVAVPLASGAWTCTYILPHSARRIRRAVRHRQQLPFPQNAKSSIRSAAAGQFGCATVPAAHSCHAAAANRPSVAGVRPRTAAGDLPARSRAHQRHHRARADGTWLRPRARMGLASAELPCGVRRHAAALVLRFLCHLHRVSHRVSEAVRHAQAAMDHRCRRWRGHFQPCLSSCRSGLAE